MRFIILQLFIYFYINHGATDLRNNSINITFYSVARAIDIFRETRIRNHFMCKRITPPLMIIERNIAFMKNLLFSFLSLIVSLWIYTLIVCCGDVEMNPGPSISSSTSSSSISSETSLSSLPYDSHFSICHLNIQSLLPKIDILQYEMQPFDVFVFTESWLNIDIGSNDLKILNFNEPFRCDRETRAGGVAIYVKESITCKRRPDLEINNLECIWIEIKTHGHTLLIAGIYRPPDAHQNYWTWISESVDRAKNTNISDIILVGDLNNDLLTPSKCKHLKELIANYDFTQLINESTHFTEQSSTLIDVIITSNPNIVVASEVCDPFVPNRMRFHCPVAVILSFMKFKPQNYKRQIWKYEEADYNKYRQILSEAELSTLVTNPLDDVDTVAQKLNKVIISAAEQSIPNKMVTIRPADQPWLHNEIRKLIRQRKRIHKRAKQVNNEIIWSKFRKIRNKIVKKIRTAKLRHEHKIAMKLKDNTTDIKTWWKLSKEILNINTKSETIPNIEYNGKLYETNIEKAEALNSFFSKQSQLSKDATHVYSSPIPSIRNGVYKLTRYQ